MNISLKESYKFGKDHPKTKSKFGNKNLKVKKSVLLKSPVFSLKSSYFAPNIIGASDENGNITIIDTNAKYKNSQYRSSNSTQSNNNNTLISSEIEPLSNMIITKLPNNYIQIQYLTLIGAFQTLKLYLQAVMLIVSFMTSKTKSLNTFLKVIAKASSV